MITPSTPAFPRPSISFGHTYGRTHRQECARDPWPHATCTEAKTQHYTHHTAGHHYRTHPERTQAWHLAANVENYSLPGVGENAIDPGISPLATGIREQEDILQPIEVPVGGCIAANQHGFQEGVPLGYRQ